MMRARRLGRRVLVVAGVLLGGLLFPGAVVFAAAPEAPMKAVIFDLWDTLVEWPAGEAEVLKARLAKLVPIEPDEFERRWREGYRASQTGPLADAYRALGHHVFGLPLRQRGTDHIS